MAVREAREEVGAAPGDKRVTTRARLTPGPGVDVRASDRLEVRIGRETLVYQVTSALQPLRITGGHRRRHLRSRARRLMPVKPCVTCGVLLMSGSHCSKHSPKNIKRPTPGRSGQTAFASAVLLNAGHRCEAVEDGVRCAVTQHLQVHHIVRLRVSRSMDPAGGGALCRRHHALASAAERRSPLACSGRSCVPRLRASLDREPSCAWTNS